MMIVIEKPSFKESMIWANSAALGDKTRPNDNKIMSGFRYGEIPLHSNFNWYGNTFSQYSAHSCQYGVPLWDAGTEYQKGSLVLSDDSASGSKKIFISNVITSGDDPDGSNNWRLFHSALLDMKDVILNSAIDTRDTLIQMPIPSDAPDIIYDKIWTNVNELNILGLDELIDVYGESYGSSALVSVNTTEVGDAWVKKPFFLLTKELFLGDYGDVSIRTPDVGDTAPVPTEGDVLGFNGTDWQGMTMESYPRWDEDVKFKPDYFNPPVATENVIGGVRVKIDEPNQLTIMALRLDVPPAPINLEASNNNALSVDLTWETISSSNPTDGFHIFRDDVFLITVPAGTSPYSYSDDTAEMYKIYEYKIYAYNSEGRSLPSLTTFGIRNDLPADIMDFSASDAIDPSYVLCDWSIQDSSLIYHLYKRATTSNDDNDYEYCAGGILPPYRYVMEPNQEFTFAVKASNSVGSSQNFSNPDNGATADLPGQKLMLAGGNFYYPKGYDKIRITLLGAGGSGSTGDADNWHSGGGYAGEIKEVIIEDFKLTTGTGNAFVQVIVGQGGVVSSVDTVVEGTTGGLTSISYLDNNDNTKYTEAQGGNGGSMTSANYAGNGRRVWSEYTNSFFNDGLHSDRPWSISCYGGQASMFGHGGSRSGQIPGPGAGGSSISVYEKSYDNIEFCNGGNGAVLFEWGWENTDTNTDTGTESVETKYRKEVLSEMLRGYPHEIDMMSKHLKGIPESHKIDIDKKDN